MFVNTVDVFRTGPGNIFVFSKMPEKLGGMPKFTEGKIGADSYGIQGGHHLLMKTGLSEEKTGAPGIAGTGPDPGVSGNQA